MRFVILLTSLLAMLSFASERGVKVSLSTGQTLDLYGDSYALVVGVSDYTAGWPNLISVNSEADEISALLREQGFKVTSVKNPDSDSLEDAFEDFVDAHGYNPTNRLLFYFAGHGFTRANNTKGYLVPSDAPNPSKDERGFLRKAYAMSDLLALARRIEANHALFLFDSCFSGTIFKTRALPNEPPLISQLTSMPVRQFITAGDAGQAVPAKSVFAPALQDAIRYGLADLNNDSYVTGSELGMFLQDVVTNSSLGNQTPQYGKINDYELARGDFVFLTNGQGFVDAKQDVNETQKAASNNSKDTRLESDRSESLRELGVQLSELEKRIKLKEQVYKKEKSELDFIKPLAASGAVARSEILRQEKVVSDAESEVGELEKSRGRLVRRIMELSVFAPVKKDDVAAVPNLVEAEIESASGTSFVLIGAGDVKLGTAKGQRGRRSNEIEREVTITRDFYLSKYEITNEEYTLFDSDHRHKLNEYDRNVWQNLPVTGISWVEAIEYCNWMSRREGLTPAYARAGDSWNLRSPHSEGYRLPTEAEWVLALGVLPIMPVNKRPNFPWGESVTPPSKIANLADESARGVVPYLVNGYQDGWRLLAPVGSFPPNKFGLFDMVGNVAEWTNDRYRTSVPTGPETDPIGPANGGVFVIRGSSAYMGRFGELRTAFRDYGKGARDDVGFRVAKTLQ